LDNHHQQSQIASYVGKLLRDNFGKGPETVYVSLGYTFITIYLRNFMSPMERVLMEQKQQTIVEQTRDTLMQKKLISEIRAYITFVTGVEIREFYYDWGLHNQSGLFVGISLESFTNQQMMYETYNGRDEIHEEIIKISAQAEKAPTEIYSYQLNPRTLLVIRNGILVNIEKQFIRLGFEQTLRMVKRDLEKRYLHNTNRFETILQTKVIDLFVDWDFILDKSVICLIMNPIE
jgi:uncharacterized protein YbcI